MKSKDSELIAEAYSKVWEQTTNAQPGQAIPMPMGKGGSMSAPMPMGKGGSTAVPMPGLSQQNKPVSQFKNTTALERMKDFWDMLVATRTNDKATVKRILTKYGMTYTP